MRELFTFLPLRSPVRELPSLGAAAAVEVANVGGEPVPFVGLMLTSKMREAVALESSTVCGHLENKADGACPVRVAVSERGLGVRLDKHQRLLLYGSSIDLGYRHHGRQNERSGCITCGDCNRRDATGS